jgi:hypothetical protein
MMADRMKSPAYEVLRASSRRLLLFIEQEIARQAGSAGDAVAATGGTVRI